MIRLHLAPEPPSFKKNVREPGENALALLEGIPLPHKRSGAPIKATKSNGDSPLMVNGKPVKKTVADFPYWTRCLDDLHRAYNGICAYYCFRCEKASLPQVDHFIPKGDYFVAKGDQSPNLAYEWSNFRLACGAANTLKNRFPDVLDPAQIEDGWFQLDVNSLRVYANPALSPPVREKIDATITRLKLSEGDALAARQHAISHFRQGRANFAFLELDHPFLARELARQGIHTNTQLPPLPPHVTDFVEPEVMGG